MSGVTFTTITQIGASTWRYTWIGVPPFRVYLEGTLLDTVTDFSYDYEVYGATSEPPALEILDAEDVVADGITNPARLILQWRAVAGANRYLVKEYTGGEWVTRATLAEMRTGYYQFQTEVMADVVAHQWRVTAQDQYANESPALTLTELVVRNPPPPASTMAWNAGTGKLDVEAA